RRIRCSSSPKQCAAKARCYSTKKGNGSCWSGIVWRSWRRGTSSPARSFAKESAAGAFSSTRGCSAKPSSSGFRESSPSAALAADGEDSRKPLLEGFAEHPRVEAKAPAADPLAKFLTGDDIPGRQRLQTRQRGRASW